MSYLKATNFTKLESVSRVPTDPSMYKNLETEMEVVLNRSANQIGEWWVVLCKGVATSDSNLAIGHYYLAFYALDQSGLPMEGPSDIVAAPCPPFCTDQTPGGKSIRSLKDEDYALTDDSKQ